MINPFSPVLLLLVILCFFTKSIKQVFINLLLLTTFVQLFIEVGFFIKIGESDINYRTVCEFLLFFFSLFLLFRKGRIQISPYFKVGGLLFIGIVLGMILLFIFPSGVQIASIDASWDEILFDGASLSNPDISGFVLQQTFQFVIAIVVLFACFNNFDLNDYLILLKRFSFLVKIFLSLAFFEFILKYLFGFDGYGKILIGIFGLAESTIVMARQRGFGLELQGLTKEASHFAYALFVSILILFTDKFVSKSKNYFWIFLGSVLLFFSMSFSALLFGIAILTVLLFARWNNVSEKSKFREQILLVTFAAIIVFFLVQGIATLGTEGFFSRRILSLVEEFSVLSNDSWQSESAALEWSNRVRLLSVFMSIKAFLHRPLFGFGLGSITCHGSTVMMLSGVGLIGLFLWIKFFFSFVRNKFSLVNKTYFRISVAVFLLVNVLNSLALRPFYEFHTFILAISFAVMFKKTSEL